MNVSFNYDTPNYTSMTVEFDNQEQIEQLFEALTDRDELGELKAAVLDQIEHHPAEEEG